MQKRYVTIWFPYLRTDWLSIRRPNLRELPIVFVAPDHGRMVICATNAIAEKKGAFTGMVLADARAIISNLEVFNDNPSISQKLLKAIGAWCIRYSPIVGIDATDGLILDVSGCPHLWNGEENYITDIAKKLKQKGYTVRISISDTIGASWAHTHYGKNFSVIPSHQQFESLKPLHPAALRLETETFVRLQQLGLRKIENFLSIPATAMRRRFGKHFIQRLNQALGNEEEFFEPLFPPAEFQERLPSLEPIVTAVGISIALNNLLNQLCFRLTREAKGVRKAVFKCFRIDNKIVQIEIGTNRATRDPIHLYKLFEIRIDQLEPDLGIEVFLLDATQVEPLSPAQEELWNTASGLEHKSVAELLDRVAGRLGKQNIHRFLPAEHYWPERSFKQASSINEKAAIEWPTDHTRPLQILTYPEPIEVSAPVPDYPPMLFRHKGVVHKIKKADGPERIEQEWWIQDGVHRDYYSVEDEDGNRYWIFRSGHYEAGSWQWFLHGYFS